MDVETFFKWIKILRYHFAYERKSKEFENAGAKNVYLLRSWFDPERNYPKNIKKKFDVTFIGHYEDDGRINYLEEVVKEAGNLNFMVRDMNGIILFKNPYT